MTTAKAKPVSGRVKWTQGGELVAEIPQREAAFLKEGKAVITVGGVTGRVKQFGQIFNGKQYAYLEHHAGDLPARPAVETREPADGGQTELRNAIL